MPRLVIVIDEFASLARDLPDFVTGLVGIAQRGRSLGIHLILATQRPSGVVSADIRANTNLRIALRVTDAAESADVIDAPDAAHISRATPGRGYVRLGHASLVPFQAGRIGGRGPAWPRPARPLVRPVDWPGLGRPEPQRPSAAEQADDEITDLKVLVGQIQHAAAGLGIRAQHSPWLPPLPRTLLLRDLPGEPAGHGARRQQPLPFGLIDLPGLQRQQPAVLSLETFGHLMAAGAPRSGRSQLLRTIAASVAVSCSCADVAPVRHRLRQRRAAAARRPAALRRGGHPHPGRARRPADQPGSPPSSADGRTCSPRAASPASPNSAPPRRRATGCRTSSCCWTGGKGSSPPSARPGGGALTDVITQILAEGASAGMHLVMTGDRSLLAGRIAAMCEDKLVVQARRHRTTTP